MLFRWLVVGFLVSSIHGAESLRLVVVEGDGAINNIRLQRAKEPVVRVEAASGSPIAGAAVTFLTPTNGPGAVFINNSSTTTVITDSEGRAIGRGLRPNKTAGQFEIRVNASFEGSSASARIIQTNAEPVEISRSSSKTIAILAIVGGAVAGGAAFAARGGGSRSPSASAPPTATAPIPTGTSITPGAPSFGPP
jgi:hypothetical protein